MTGTNLKVKFIKVVDGDTIKVEHQGETTNLRILSLDTEESYYGGNKPVTPWGKEAKNEAIKFFKNEQQVLIEFPGKESEDICWKKYRGNYGRPLVYVYRESDQKDFQEHMIANGYSSYFSKYGYASFEENHSRYQTAEITAQINNIGVWNQIEVNGSELRNYAQLSVWWNLRAAVIDQYRLKKVNQGIYNTRLDYDTLLEKANQEEEAAIFTELRTLKRVGGKHGMISIGSIEKPFLIFIPNIDEEKGQKIVNLAINRYISTDLDHPRQSYCYIKGKLKMYNGTPEIILLHEEQLFD